MNKNNPESKLKDFIFHKKNFIPESVCDDVLNYIKTGDWIPHNWYNQLEGKQGPEEKELDILPDLSDEMQGNLSKYLHSAFIEYNQKYKFDCIKTQHIAFEFSRLRFNRYQPGKMMKRHHDHIYSIFDGNLKGIPVISVIINFNDDYEGGQLYFWDNYELELGKGDIVLFPSLFMYPHGVKEPTKGERYSAVCWAW